MTRYRKKTTPYVPADATRERLAELQAAGATVRGIAAATGLTPSCISGVNRPRQTRVQRRTADLIATVTLRDVIAATTGRVPSIGTKRRIRALMAMGWRHQDIKAHSGITTHTVIGHGSDRRAHWVLAETHRAILDTYDALWDKRGPSAVTRLHAQRQGWATPAAWDDEAIDDPTGQPAAKPCAEDDCTRTVVSKGLCTSHYTARREGRELAGQTRLDIDALTDCADWGLTVTQTAERLGVQRDTVTIHLDRLGDHDLTARFARNGVAWEMAA